MFYFKYHLKDIRIVKKYNVLLKVSLHILNDVSNHPENKHLQMCTGGSV